MQDIKKDVFEDVKGRGARSKRENVSSRGPILNADGVTDRAAEDIRKHERTGRPLGSKLQRQTRKITGENSRPSETGDKKKRNEYGVTEIRGTLNPLRTGAWK